MKRVMAAGLVALGIAAAAPGVASAMPIRGFVAEHDAEVDIVGARAYSPATADGCGAFYRVAVYDLGGNARKVRQGKFNACRYETTGSRLRRRVQPVV
jgi:hypothetical protein